MFNMRWSQLRIQVNNLPDNVYAEASGNIIFFSRKFLNDVKNGVISKSDFFFVFLHELVHVAQQAFFSLKMTKNEFEKYVERNRNALEKEADEIAIGIVSKGLALFENARKWNGINLCSYVGLVRQQWMVDGDGAWMMAGEAKADKVNKRKGNIDSLIINIDHDFSDKLVEEFVSDADSAGIHEMFTSDALDNLLSHVSVKKLNDYSVSKNCRTDFADYIINGKYFDSFSVFMGSSFNDRYFYQNVNLWPIKADGFAKFYKSGDISFINASHHGGMQFLHSMDCSNGNRALNRDKIFRWTNFCLDVFYNKDDIQNITFRDYLNRLSANNESDVFFSMIWQMILEVPLSLEDENRSNPQAIKEYIVPIYKEKIELLKKINELYYNLESIAYKKIDFYLTSVIQNSSQNISLDLKKTQFNLFLTELEKDLGIEINKCSKEINKDAFSLVKDFKHVYSFVSEVRTVLQECFENECFDLVNEKICEISKKRIDDNNKIINVKDFESIDENKWGYNVHLFLCKYEDYSSIYYKNSIKDFFNGKLLKDCDRNWSGKKKKIKIQKGKKEKEEEIKESTWLLDAGSVALGSVCHMIQDSFAQSHTRRCVDPFNLCAVDKKFSVELESSSTGEKWEVCRSNGYVQLKDYEIVEDRYVSEFSYESYRKYLKTKAMPIILFSNYVYQDSNRHSHADIFVELKEKDPKTKYDQKNEKRKGFRFTSNSEMARDCSEEFLYFALFNRQKAEEFVKDIYQHAKIEQESLTTHSGLQYGTLLEWLKCEGRKYTTEKSTEEFFKKDIALYESILSSLMCYNLKEPIQCRISVLIDVVKNLDRIIRKSIGYYLTKRMDIYSYIIEYCNLHVNEIIAEMNAIKNQLEVIPNENYYKVNKCTKQEILRNAKNDINILNGWIKRLCANQKEKLRYEIISNEKFDDSSVIDEITVVKGDENVPQDFEKINVNLNQNVASLPHLYLCYRRCSNVLANQKIIVDIVAALDGSKKENLLQKDQYEKISENYIGPETRKMYLYCKKIENSTGTLKNKAIDEIRVLKNVGESEKNVLDGFIKVEDDLNGLHLYYSCCNEKYVITKICFIEGADAEVPIGFEKINVDLNMGCSKGIKNFFMCYKRDVWTYGIEAIRNMAVACTESEEKKLQSEKYVKFKDDKGEDVDFNKGTKGDKIYLYYLEEKSTSVNNFLRDIAIIKKDEKVPDGYEIIETDLNKGAGGEYLYLYTKHW